jgi:methionine-rich copper-binding protein CopC
MNIKHLVAIATMTIATAISTSAYAHAKLEASSPKADTVVAAAPKEVRLQFNEQIELPFSKVKLLDQKGVAVETSKLDLDKSDPKAMVATIPPLRAGSYRVQWSTVTRDGHKVKGEFSFQVK